MKHILNIFIVVFIAMLLVGGGYWVYQTGYFVKNTRASQVALSPDASIVFVTPSTIPIAAGGRLTVSVFCLDTRGIGISNIEVSLSPNNGLLSTPTQVTTDEKGKASFYIQGLIAGSYDLDVFCQGSKLDAKASFSFL